MSWGNKGRARSIASVLCCLAVVLGELVLLTAVYHRPAAVHRQRVTQAQLWGQLSDGTPSTTTAGHITTAIATLRHEGVSPRDLADLTAAGRALTLNPSDRDALIKARTADDALGLVLRDRQQTIDDEAETVYIVLLALASIGWFGWFRRVIRKQRELAAHPHRADRPRRGRGEARRPGPQRLRRHRGHRPRLHDQLHQPVVVHRGRRDPRGPGRHAADRPAPPRRHRPLPARRSTRPRNGAQQSLNLRVRRAGRRADPRRGPGPQLRSTTRPSTA